MCQSHKRVSTFHPHQTMWGGSNESEGTFGDVTPVHGFLFLFLEQIWSCECKAGLFNSCPWNLSHPACFSCTFCCWIPGSGVFRQTPESAEVSRKYSRENSKTCSGGAWGQGLGSCEVKGWSFLLAKRRSAQFENKKISIIRNNYFVLKTAKKATLFITFFLSFW